VTLIALATAAEVADLDPDDRLLADALARRGVRGVPAVWDDADVAWDRFDLVVVRSTWDYAPRRDAFLAWAETVGGATRLHNPAEVLRWNTDKRYLRDLAADGVPVVPTHWVEPGDAVAWPGDWDEFVVKPAVSAGSKDTARYLAVDRATAEAHVGALAAAGRTVMIQPYLPGVDTAGETAVLYLDDRCSHAIRKGPLLRRGAGFVTGLYAEEEITPRSPAPTEQAVADRVMAATRVRWGPLLYARVDLVPGPDGRPLLLELELTEPSLFLAHAENAADRFAEAVLRALAT
jgi:glutathione synthase/RimK-type ligase-like ATP-grasp enzyme